MDINWSKLHEALTKLEGKLVGSGRNLVKGGRMLTSERKTLGNSKCHI